MIKLHLRSYQREDLVSQAKFEDDLDAVPESCKSWGKIKKIVTSYFCHVKEYDLNRFDLKTKLLFLNQIADYLEKHKDNEIKFWQLLNRLALVELIYGYMLNQKESYFAEPMHSNLNELNGLLINGSERCKEIRDKIITLGLHRFIIRDMEHPSIQRRVLKYNGNRSSFELTRCDEALDTLFTVIYNVLRYNPDSQKTIRNEGICRICMLYLGSAFNIPGVKAIALLVLSLSADLDSEQEIVQATECNIKYVVCNLLENAVKSASRRNEEGYTVEELLDCLTRLAKNRNNATELLKCNIVKICCKILNEDSEELEVIRSLCLIWSLSFLDEGQKSLQKHEMILEKIKSLIESENTDISSAAKGILWELGLIECTRGEESSEEVNNNQLDDDASTHVMISYCWKQQPIALKLFERLKNNGKKVWIDIEKMEGDSLEKMADAVENSEFVVCCFSEDYSNSQACRSEATYAYKQKKNIAFVKTQPDFEPKGWLGLILGAEIYYQLCSDSEFETNFPKLIRFIEGKNTSFENNDETDSAKVPTRKTSNVDEPGYIIWTRAEVQNWLQFIDPENSNNFGNMKNLTGQNLQELKIWQSAAPQFFLEFCRNSLEINKPKSLLDLSAALRALQ